MADPDAQLAEKLVRMMKASATEALTELGNDLKARVIADLPKGDPTLDPDPSYALRDHVEVRVYGKFVSVSVEGKYAIKQHEAIYLKHVRGGHSKYLERNAAIVIKLIPSRLEGVVKRTFAGGKSFTTKAGGA